MSTTGEPPLGKEWLSTTLTELGSTADEVAASLRTAKITGRPYDPEKCPVARYVTQRARNILPTVLVTVTIGSIAGLTIQQGGGIAYPRVEVPLTRAVSDFVCAFDQGDAYADLVEDQAA
jgi:peptidoglycan/LPS O-acetylase OafA/YrhL